MAGPDTFRAAVEEVAFTGRVVYIGYAKDHVSYETRLFVQKELDILGSRNALPQDFKEVIRMFEQKRFPTAEAISATVPLEGSARDSPCLERESGSLHQDHDLRLGVSVALTTLPLEELRIAIDPDFPEGCSDSGAEGLWR